MTKKQKLKLDDLLDVMYNMYSYNVFPTLSINELGIMWMALIKKRRIKVNKENFSNFLNDLNDDNYNKYSNFANLFEKYFLTETFAIQTLNSTK